LGIVGQYQPAHQGTNFDTVRYAEASVFDESEKPHALVCNEVWGGNRKVFRTVKMASLIAWVASVPFEEDEGGGDLHYMSVCDHDLISRVVLADVSGHGGDVNAVTQTLHKLMRKNINAWDQSDFMRGINDMFRQGGNDRYATAIAFEFPSNHGPAGVQQRGASASAVVSRCPTSLGLARRRN
jgi:hypothetical protein